MPQTEYIQGVANRFTYFFVDEYVMALPLTSTAIQKVADGQETEVRPTWGGINLGGCRPTG
ncbi:MAG: hypothetical protein M1483_01545 [Actinobacteria bacterium]|nr:hypothetical protein [Actinomycetota bacterium]MCL6104314.1 hypothetical protein [Actinomycetota bacterium]